MRNFYTERNYINNEDFSNNYSTSRINRNSLFRNFLIDENVDDSRKKFFAPKKKEILPSYINLKEKIETGRSQIKSYFNIKDSIFKEIQVKDLISYSKFAKNIADFFFGPLGFITKKEQVLKNYHKQKQKEKKLNTKIYAGRWLYLDENPKYTRFLARLKNNRKQILNLGGNFATEDDPTQRLHDIYLRSSTKKKIKNKNEKKSPVKNIFEFTAIEKPHNKINSYTSRRKINKRNINNLLLNISPDFGRNKYNHSIEKKWNKTMYNDNDSYKRKNKIKNIKNIFYREKLFRKENLKKKKYFSNLKLTINKKINILNSPVKNMQKEINLIKKKNQTHYNFREKKDQFREDIKVIGEDNQKQNDDFMETFIKKAYRLHLQNSTNPDPKKIFFTYIEKKGNTVRESLKAFVRNIERIKDQERQIRYGKSIRDQFQINYKTIRKLANELDELKIKKKILFDS